MATVITFLGCLGTLICPGYLELVVATHDITLNGAFKKSDDITIQEVVKPILSRMGSKNLGFNVDTYLQSEQGKWVLKHFRNYFASVSIGYDQTSEENKAYWAKIGMEKTYFAGDDAVKEWSVFKPVDIDDPSCITQESKSYPVLFAMHAGGTNILMAENMGFVEDAAKNKYIVVCPSWSLDNLSDAQMQSFKNSGMKYFEAYTFKTILERVKNMYNIDEERVYCAGFSGGGNACAYAAIECPTLLTGTSPATGVAIQTTNDVSEIAKYGMAMIMVYGLYDAEERWPIKHEPVELGPVEQKETLEERIANVNAWNSACGAVNANATLKSVKEEAADGGHDASTEFGLRFDHEYNMDYETEYSFGDLYNYRGQTIVRYLSIEGCPHFCSPNWASEVYKFFSGYRRDKNSHKMIVTGLSLE